MGYTNWSNDSFRSFASDNIGKSRDKIFTSRSVPVDMTPDKITFRESRDSSAHPNSLAIIVNLDTTGSMGQIPEKLVKGKFGTFMETLLAHGVPDAHVLFGGVNDHYTSNKPLQVGQFEAGTDELNKWLTSMFLEGGGGGQDMESYSLAWLFAARHTSIDCFEKRGEKGFLFTIGDEWVHPELEASKLEKIFDKEFKDSVTSVQALKEAQKMYHVFHLCITETQTGRDPRIADSWNNLLGERNIIVKEHEMVAEIMASTVAVVRGANIKDVVSGFDNATADAVSSALVKVGSGVSHSNQQSGIIKL